MKTVRAFSVLALAFACSRTAAAQTPLSLEDALQQARSANARLPLPALDLAAAREKYNEARAARWLKVAFEGDFILAPPSGYDPIVTNLGDYRLQVVARQPLYDGGAIKAAESRADADFQVAGARFRIALRDLELDVRSRFAELLEAKAGAGARREGIERLKTYRLSLRSRRASGQGVAADLLKTDVRLASEEANVLEAERRMDEARLALNDLMGRDPSAPLELAPLPAPEPPTAPGGEPWMTAPELEAAEAETRSAGAGVAAVRAESRPHLTLSADLGLWGSDTSHAVPEDVHLNYGPNANFWDRLRRDAGYSFSLVVSWPVWDTGGIRARQAQARIGLEQARRKLEIGRRSSRLQWEQASAALSNLYSQIDVLSRAAPDARDSYLEAESRYRGGAATALEVLDAYAASVDAAVRLADAVARYHVARAVQIRWGGP
ncbi:MAG TPA: TolC family protein [Thermoanaerobaculia bacterium]|nr:TolC family protein [Thermoanaerobaculia bacterium]